MGVKIITCLHHHHQNQGFKHTNPPNHVVIVFPSMPTTITPSNPRKSGRVVHRPNRMDGTVTTSNPKGIVIHLTHDLMAPNVSIPRSNARKLIRVLQVKAAKSLPCNIDVAQRKIEMNRVVVPLMIVNRGIIVLITTLDIIFYEKCMAAKDTVKDYRGCNKDLLADVYTLKIDLSITEKSIDITRDNTRKPQASVELVSKLIHKYQSLTGTVSYLTRDYQQLLESKGTAKSHYDDTLKLNVARMVQNRKCDATKLELAP